MGPVERSRLYAVWPVVKRWADLWGAPFVDCLTIARIETAYRPGLRNLNERALKVGGAWGLMQITADTAATLIRKATSEALDRGFGADLVLTVAKWHPAAPESLLDLDLNACLGTFYVAQLHRRFHGNSMHTFAAYHQGPNAIAGRIARGERLPEQLPPNGRIYVARALAAKLAIAQFLERTPTPDEPPRVA